MSVDNSNINKDITNPPSAAPPPSPPVAPRPSTEAKVEAARTDNLTAIPKSKPESFRATRFNTEMYRSNKMERIFLAAFLRSAAFGSETQLSQEGEATEFRDLLNPKSILGGDLSSEKVAIALSAKQTITGYRLQKQRNDSTDRPVALIITGSFGPAGKYAAPMARAYLDQGYDVFIVDPVGFGASQQAGKPTPENFMQSAEAAAEYVRTKMQGKNEKIIVHGYSLGGFAAAHVAGLKENHGMNVVLDRTAQSTGQVAKGEVSRMAGKIAGKLARKITQTVIPYDLKQTLPKIKGRVLVVQETGSKPGSKDAASLVEKMKGRLSEGVEDPVRKGGKHITDFSGTWTQTYGDSYQRWRAFVKKIKP